METTKIKLNDRKVGIEIILSGDRVMVAGLWEDKGSKSKAGKPNFSWHPKNLWDDAVCQYVTDVLGLTIDGRDQGGKEEVPF